MKIKVLNSLLLALSFGFVLTSCGNKEEKSSSSKADASSEIVASSEVAASSEITQSSETISSSSGEIINNYTREENTIYFGTYPQTKVEATTENGLFEITYDSTWKSYKYNVLSTQSDFMYYKDVDIDNNGTYDYRGVYFTSYRPYDSSYSSSADFSFQDDNLYLTDNTYWFSYDLIEWKILNEDNGKALVISNLILDSQDYYSSSYPISYSKFNHNGGTGYANNYELSNIRKFLNDDFYNMAFNDLQKGVIEKITLDNSASTTVSTSNKFKCNDTKDKVFLLSFQESNKTYFNDDATRTCKGTDYAKCQGLYVYSSDENSGWLLRSPDYGYDYYACYVKNTGVVMGDGRIDLTYYGVRPACWIKL